MMNLYKEKPREICIEVTTCCNSKCEFCYNKNSFSKNGRKLEYLPTDKIKEMIDIIKNAGINRIRFTGGEPLTRKDIFELAKYAKDKGITTVLNTNGILVNEEYGKKIIKYFDICLLSFFSLDEEYLEKTTGVKDIYKKKIKALKNIHGCKSIWCSTVISDKNLSTELQKIYELMEEYNVYNWFLLRKHPIEDNKNPHTFEEIEKLIDSIIQLEEKTGYLLHIGNAMPFCCYKPEDIRRIVEDGSLNVEGRSRMIVDPKGNFVVDYCIRDNLGNIFEDDLLSCWQSQKLQEIRGEKNLPSVCQKCKYKDSCMGGSRFTAKMLYGKYDYMDPLARPQKYKELLFNE